ncbi:MCE family protein [Tomitella biformata]|uniref:MCE family protein n=1 Tax=Tomitella biformata TaxID=630403 RepID=UPI0004AFE01A|nr:MCE family protein [Tomitella biformata]
MAVMKKLSTTATTLIVLGVTLALIVGAAAWFVLAKPKATTITAYFDRAIGIYVGSEVRVLGVEVGKVTAVTPRGPDVEVVLKVNGDIDLPEDVRALQVTPSVVPDRFIQLTPAYEGGPKLDKTATLAADRTKTPVEIDQLYESLTEVSQALGPDGMNADGTVTNLVNTAAANLDGNGRALNSTIAELSAAARTLSDSRGDIFDTVKNLQVFANTLAVHDDDVRQFNTQMQQFSSFLDDERDNMAGSIQTLSVALGDVARFVGDNKSLLESNIGGLETVTGTIANRNAELKESLALLPLAISNLINAYDASTGLLHMRLNFPDLQDPIGAGCELLNMGKLGPGIPEFEALKRQMAPLINNCHEIANQITSGVKTPMLNLPFGILSGDNLQRDPLPGSVPGEASPRFSEPSAPAGGGN